MGEHRAVIGAGMVGFTAVRPGAADAMVATGCTVWSPTRGAQGWSIDDLAGAILGPEPVP